MDIRDWPLDRIMQLPEWCFGRKFPVCCAAVAPVDTVVWDISEVGLPEMCVLWQANIDGYVFDGAASRMRIALGDQLPTTTAMMDALDPLINGMGMQGPGPRQIGSVDTRGPLCMDMKMPISAGGRRLVVEVTAAGTKAASVNVVLIVSTIPKEVPDWLISGQGRGL